MARSEADETVLLGNAVIMKTAQKRREEKRYNNLSFEGYRGDTFRGV